jgi:murein DD-endopeptidase MepM/ murein hydrolase activator NlpD
MTLVAWILVLFGLSSCADLDDPDEAPSTSAHESELASGWLSPIIATPPYGVTCGSSAHVNGALYAADVAVPYGAPVYAAHGGVIEIAGWDPSGYGNLVKLRPADFTGYRHYYAHLKDIHSSVKGNIGAHVDKDQLIGWVGNTGNVTGTHLHFHVQNDLGVGVTLIGMTGFTDNSNDPYYPSNDGVSHYPCAWMGR